jgi:serine/threonine protein kinase
MSGAIDLSAGGVSWQVRPAWLAGLASLDEVVGPDGLRLPEWLAAGRARVVKPGPHRTVYRVTLPGSDFHVKQYHPTDRRARLRALFRPSPARAEYERTLAVAERGVPTLVPLAVGEAPGASFVVTRTVAAARSLADVLETDLPALPPLRQARLRQVLAGALGRFLARLHDAGVTHRDLHPGNILCRLEGEAVELYLIDLPVVRLGPPLDWPAQRANLVLLNRWFVLRAGRADRLRCWHAYAGGRPAHELAQGARDLEKRTLASNLQFWRRHDRRCLGDNRYFRRLRAPGLTGHSVADLDAQTLAGLLADPDGPFPQPDRGQGRGGRVLKHSASSSVVEMDLPTPAEPCAVIYKRFAVTAWTDPWAALVRPTAALRSYVMGHGLRLRCLPTPRPLAVWHRVRHGLHRESYLLTEKVPAALDLLRYLERLRDRPEGRAALRRLIDQVARLIRVLHARHLSHRDLKAANLLVSPQRWEVSAKGIRTGSAGEEVAVWFIDLVGVRRHGKLGRRRRVQNLARLNTSFHRHPGLTRSDRLRFLRVYLAWGLHGKMGWKRWWRQVEEATRAKIERNRRNGRPLG